MKRLDYVLEDSADSEKKALPKWLQRIIEINLYELYL